MATIFIVQFVLIFVNAFLAMSELATVSLNETVLQYKSENGDKKATALLKISKEPMGFLSTIQVGITLAGFMASAFAAEGFSEVLANWAIKAFNITNIPFETMSSICVVLITIVLSFFMLVLGELFPKRLAMKNPEKVANFTFPVVNFLSGFFKPLVWLLTISTNGMLRLFKIDPDEPDDEVSEDVIKMMIDIGEEKGAIEADEREFINNIFDLNDIAASDVMIHRTDMIAISSEDTKEEILETIRTSGLSRFPVYDESIDDVVGILRAREYLLGMSEGLDSAKLMQRAVSSAYFVPESVKASQLLSDMRKKKIHMAIVVDEYGGTSGLLTLEDLLEEIVGQIYDETDPLAQREIVQIDDNLWRVSGSCEIEDLCEALNIPIPENDDFDTLGGWMFSQLSFIPEDGSNPEVDVCGVHIKAELIEDKRLESALVSIIAPIDSDADSDKKEKAAK